MDLPLPEGLRHYGVQKHVSMHARRRYCERMGNASDEEILAAAADDPRAVWKGDVLVTFLSSPLREQP